MTVKQLKEFLADKNDHMEVMAENSEWGTVEEMHIEEGNIAIAKYHYPDCYEQVYKNVEGMKRAIIVSVKS